MNPRLFSKVFWVILLAKLTQKELPIVWQQTIFENACANFCLGLPRSLLKRTQSADRQTDGQTDGRLNANF